MVLAPERASLGLTAGGTAVLGVKDIKVTKKTTQKDITCDNDTAVRRFGTIQDGDLSLTIVYDPADTGQQAILASEAALTQIEYVATKGTVTYTATAGIDNISFGGGPADEQTLEVTLAVSGGIAIS